MSNEATVNDMPNMACDLDEANVQIGLLDLHRDAMLQVFEHLPAKDIQRLRQVCRGFQSFVDSKEIKSAVSSVILKRETKRIVDHLNYYVFYTDKPPIVERFNRSCDIRGIWRCNGCNLFLRKQFEIYMLSTLPPPPPPPYNIRFTPLKSYATIQKNAFFDSALPGLSFHS